MGVVNLMVVLGLGVYLRELYREGLGLLGDKKYFNVASLVIGVGVVSWWAVDNLVGMFLGISVSVGYGMVMIMGAMMWLWGELKKMGDGGLKTYCGHYMVPGLRGGLALFLPFMELLSILIRPVTLSVRLSTNITSGHVLLIMVGLLGSVGGLAGISVGVVGWLLGLMEVFVSILQAGIFAMLVMIYMD